MPPAESNDVKIMNKSIVCEDSTLRGDITISQGCVIHPSASILAEAGPIILGENCIVEEYATIAYRLTEEQKRQKEEGNLEPCPPLVVGSNNVFEVGCIVEAQKIGDKNVFECKCYVGPEVVVTNGCVVGAAVSLKCKQVLPESTVIYGRDCQQREAIDKYAYQTLQIDFLRKVLPNYHHLRKPNQDPKRTRSVV
ncbi:dynactin subunit 6 [Musca domestica]|uniref:Dynactin subunit 6 n=1 Tax=Musca domestica TaxID=7370 RepID=A0A9J7I2H4_MUSDO|nr:dynactin subunit 6 [Musca domestica]